jgi:hypothetical protein
MLTPALEERIFDPKSLVSPGTPPRKRGDEEGFLQMGQGERAEHGTRLGALCSGTQEEDEETQFMQPCQR